MAIKYKHSHVFQHLKQIQETIKDNYSSAQYVEALDSLLYRAIKPIILNTDFCTVYLSEILHLSMRNHRRKISHLTREKFSTAILLYLISSPERRFKIYKKLRLDRNFTYFIIREFLKESAEYEEVYINSLSDSSQRPRKLQLENKCKLFEGKDLLTTIKTVSNFSHKYSDFKKYILEKYIRSILMYAQNHYKMTNSKIELDDVIQTMTVYASYAIDKYDETKGTLYSYIMVWMQHARNQSNENELETSFLLPQSKRGTNRNTSVNIEDVKDLVAEEDDNSERDRVRHLSKIADPVGLARMALDIQEVLTREEIMIQKNGLFQ